MKIKKHPNKNDYCLSKSGHWVRDFTKPLITPIDINDLMPLDDIRLCLNNEIKNKGYQQLEFNTVHDKIIIMGDGYNYENNMKLLDKLPADIIVIGVNGIFSRWNCKRRLNYYLVNNPYQECLYYYPQKIYSWPKCIASNRTYYQFLEVYQGPKHIYYPSKSPVYDGVDGSVQIDDYRNSVCAAIGVAYKFRVKKLLLMSTMEMYKEERVGMEEVNGMWLYPQQKTAQYLIDANLYWLQKAKISVAYCDKALDYEFASYISAEEFYGRN